MSLGVAIKGPEGIVLACDSRISLVGKGKDSIQRFINFDNAQKLLCFSKPHNFVGVVTYGQAVIGLRTAYSFVPEFEKELEQNKKQKRLSIEEYAKMLSGFYSRQWEQNYPDNYDGPSMLFFVGGFNEGDAYGKVFIVDIPRKPTPIERNPGDKGFGMSWGGQLHIANRIIHGYDPILPDIIKNELNINDEQIKKLLGKLRENLEYTIPYNVLPLQDCVDLANFIIGATINTQSFSIGDRGVGGPIEIAIITRTDGLEFVKRKSININNE